ncbi:MAG: helix-turn-helix domain-containing protein [Candidatus Nanohalobium sp.]
MTEKKIARKYIENTESDEIGGTLLLILGGQGSGKTSGLWNMAGIDFNQDRIVFYRGQRSCSWIGLCANGLPVTLWMHESIEDYTFKVRGDKRKGIPEKEIDIENKEDVDVKVRRFSGPDELVEKAEVDRINVHYIPGEKWEDKKEFYFFLDQEKKFAEALNTRSWGNPVSKYDDEFGNVGTEDDSYPYHRLIKYGIPNEYADFRKNGVKQVSAGHDTSEIHYKFYKVKFNRIMYMKGAKVDSGLDPEIDQSKVNEYDAGEFILAEGRYNKDHFEEPTYPEDAIDWIPEQQSRRLQMEIEADIPDVVDEKDKKQQELEDSLIKRSDLDEFIGTREAADILGCSNSNLRNLIRKGQVPAIKVNNRHILSIEQVLDKAEN